MKAATFALACMFAYTGYAAAQVSPQNDTAAPVNTPAGCTSGTADKLAAEDDSAGHEFLSHVQDALRSNDPKQVAALVRFPLRVNGLKPAVVSQAVFLKRYNDILPQAIKDSVLNNNNAHDCLFHNYQGYMVGDGTVWFDRIRKQDFRITTINLPTPK